MPAGEVSVLPAQHSTGSEPDLSLQHSPPGQLDSAGLTGPNSPFHVLSGVFRSSWTFGAESVLVSFERAGLAGDTEW